MTDSPSCAARTRCGAPELVVAAAGEAVATPRALPVVIVVATHVVAAVVVAVENLLTLVVVVMVVTVCVGTRHVLERGGA